MLCSRFCICMLHEQFTRWLTTLHKIILAHHDEHCECDCGFCVSCVDLDSLSIGGFMRLMLCPPSLRFHGSTIPFFDWNCIDDKYVCFLSLFRVFNFYSWILKGILFFMSFLFYSCNLCHSNKLESLFECPISRLLYDEGEVEYWMYKPVDLTEQSATNAATGLTMQGVRHVLLYYCFW